MASSDRVTFGATVACHPTRVVLPSSGAAVGLTSLPGERRGLARSPFAVLPMAGQLCHMCVSFTCGHEEEEKNEWNDFFDERTILLKEKTSTHLPPVGKCLRDGVHEVAL